MRRLSDSAEAMREVLAFRNIRYARAQRFAPAEPLPFAGCVDKERRGPVPPQNPSRYEPLMGPMEPLVQSEDCQVLSVFTNGLTGRRPVMIWFHGGAFVTGGGELPWYDGTRLAAEQAIVVVSVTARLGALGHLCLGDHDGGIGPSPATTDQLAAVEWVHRHVDQFGGDPDNITLFGQSAGGFAVEIMVRWGLGPHVKGAVIQSGFIKETGLVYTREDARRQAEAFESLIGRPPHSLTIPDMLAAQVAFAQSMGAPLVWAPVRPDVEAPFGIPLLAGMTRHDNLPYVLMEQGIAEPSPPHFDAFAAEVERRNDVDIAQQNRSLLEEAISHGARGWEYEFCWDVPESGWGSPHCIELPFLLGDREAWQGARMLRGADWNLLDARGRQLRAVWASFARDHDPGRGWIAYDPATKPINRIG